VCGQGEAFYRPTDSSFLTHNPRAQKPHQVTLRR
jgi:hypothetical protein